MKLRNTIIVLACISSCFANVLERSSTDENEIPFQLLESVQAATNFDIQSFTAKWVDDETLYYQLGSKHLVYDVFTRWNMEILQSDEQFSEIADAKVTVSPHLTHALVAYDHKVGLEAVHKCLIFNLQTQETTYVSSNDELQACQWTERGDVDQLIYIKKNNIYVKTSDGVETQISFNGIPEIVFNGFNSEQNVIASLNGVKLLYRSDNYTGVDRFEYSLYGEPGSLESQYPDRVSKRYAKSGTNNFVTSLIVADLQTPGQLLTLPVPTDKVTMDFNLGDIGWLSNDYIAAIWLNRRQNIAAIQRCNANTGLCDEVITLSRPNGWFDVFSMMTCLPEIEKCFCINDNDNNRQLYSFGISGNVNQETTGDYTVQSTLGYNSATSEVLFTAVPLANPEQRHVYLGTKCLSCAILTPEGNTCSFATAILSTDSSYYALTCSGPDPSFTNIYDTATDNLILIWEDNQETRTKLENYQKPRQIYLRVPVADGFTAAVKLTLPEEVDPETATEKYPMIVHTYALPNHVLATDEFTIGYENYLVTNRKVIYAQIDGRGTANKGVDMYYAVNNKLGSVAIEDQIAVTKYLQENFDFIDADRTGIWGWGGGGYTATMTLLQDSENVFVGGVTVAAVSSWIYYDAHNTERYMGFRTSDDNLEGFDSADLTKRAAAMQNHKYMLIHGTADNDVHFQNAMQLSRVLQKEEILFEQMSYPDEDHHLSNVIPHVFRTVTRFWSRHLQLANEIV